MPSTRHPGRVGFACASLTAGLTAGILIGSLVAAALNRHYSAEQLLEWAWRLPFLLGGAFGLLAVWLRRWLRETPVFTAMRESHQLAEELPLKRVLREHRSAVLLSMGVTWLLTAAIVVVILMTPTLLQTQFALPAGRGIYREFDRGADAVLRLHGQWLLWWIGSVVQPLC